MKRKTIDYKLKSDVIKAGLHKQIGFIDSSNYLYEVDGIVPSVNLDDLYFDLCNSYDFKWIKEARKINTASYRRRERLKDRIMKYLLNGSCIFVTLTFTDDVLDSTNEETRRKYVQRYLKSISDYYIANIDYGVDDRYTHREHYHALVLKEFIEEKWTYGYTWFERVHKANSEFDLAKYISKLTNHAIKESTKRCCYIYSRCKI